jgi:hypothetical protein
MAGLGILDRFIKQEIQGQKPEDIAFEEQMQQEMELRKFDDAAMMGHSIGQPLPQARPFQLPPSFEKETMELYLKPKSPKNTETLKGRERFWVFKDDGSATNVITSNLNRSGQKDILTKLRMAVDFNGCDNIDGLIQDNMMMINAIILTNKARSDFTDGFRERIVPSVGVSMMGNFPDLKNTGERPKESKVAFGLLGNRGGGR